jgi:photosystem II stability/assembly factor-like uncharacterized protein
MQQPIIGDIMKNNYFKISRIVSLVLLLLMLYQFTDQLHAQIIKNKDFSLEIVNGKCSNCAQSFNLAEIQFVNENTGWAKGAYLPEIGNGSGTSTILRTIDGGRKWEQIKFVDQASAEEKLPFYFINSKQGWISWFDTADAEDHFIGTVDGGNSWQKLKTPVIGTRSLIKFFNDKLWYAIEKNITDGAYFTVTKDGGTTWSLKKLQLTTINDMFFITQQVGWLFGNSKTHSILKTVDAGESWKEINLPYHWSNDYYKRDFYWRDKENGWLIIWHANDQGSYLLQTKNGSLSWKQHPDDSFQGKNKYLSCIKFITTKVGFAFYDETNTTGNINKAFMLYTKDDGEHWEQFNLPRSVESCQVFNGELWCSSGMSLIKIRLNNAK